MTDDPPPAEPLANPLADTLAAGRLALAMIVQKVPGSDIALAARTCGFDALSVDLEHSVLSESQAAQIAIAAQLAGVTPLVRVGGHDPQVIGRVLDAGAMGIVAPHVECADDARAIVDACRFAPLGSRSASHHWPHFGYRDLDPVAMRDAMNAAVTVVAMLESPAAVERADEIAAVPGIDVVHVGSLDLSDAMGLPGRLDAPEMLDAFEHVIGACRRHRTTAGIGAVGGRVDLARHVVSLGARFLTAGVDWDFLLAGARGRVRSLRALSPDPR